MLAGFLLGENTIPTRLALAVADHASACRAGNIFLVDRKKGMIISGGENIYSQEVERAIAEHKRGEVEWRQEALS